MSRSADHKVEAEEIFQKFLDLEANGKNPNKEEFLRAQRTEARFEVERMLHDYEMLRKRLGGSSIQLQEGKILSGFRLMKQIGRGGMAVVWEAEEQGLRRRVALKILDTQFSQSLHLLNRFLREARAGKQLKHKAIVRTFGAGEAEGFFISHKNLFRADLP